MENFKIGRTIFFSGDKISCFIRGDNIPEGELHYENGKWYVRNNIASGANEYMGEYQYSWFFDPGSNICDVKEIKHLNKEAVYDIY